MITQKYLVIIEKAKNNYAAYSPDVQGCVATGITIEETIENIKAALEFHLEGMQEDEDEIPAAHSLQYHLQHDLQITNGDLITEVELHLQQVIS